MDYDNGDVNRHIEMNCYWTNVEVTFFENLDRGVTQSARRYVFAVDML